MAQWYMQCGVWRCLRSVYSYGSFVGVNEEMGIQYTMARISLCESGNIGLHFYMVHLLSKSLCNPVNAWCCIQCMPLCLVDGRFIRCYGA